MIRTELQDDKRERNITGHSYYARLHITCTRSLTVCVYFSLEISK